MTIRSLVGLCPRLVLAVILGVGAITMGACGPTPAVPPAAGDPGDDPTNGDPNTPPGGTAPTVTTNFNAATFYRGTVSITAEVQPAAALTGASVSVSFGGAAVCTISSAPFTCSVDTTTLADGNNTATITVTNPIGSASTTVVVKVDNTPPTLLPPTPQQNGLTVIALGDTISIDNVADATSGLAGLELLINDSVVRVVSRQARWPIATI